MLKNDLKLKEKNQFNLGQSENGEEWVNLCCFR